MRINATNNFIGQLFFCSFSLNVCNIGLQCNLRSFSTTVLQGSVAKQVNYGKILNNLFIANLLLSVTVKNFEDRLGFGKVTAKNQVAPFFRQLLFCVMLSCFCCLYTHIAISSELFPNISVCYRRNSWRSGYFQRLLVFAFRQGFDIGPPKLQVNRRLCFELYQFLCEKADMHLKLIFNKYGSV